MRIWITVFCCLVTGVGGAPALTLTRGPFLQRGGPMAMLVVWRTDEPADSAVEHGLSPGLGLQDSDPGLKIDHALLLTDLSPWTVYHYRARGNGQDLSEVRTFKTSPDPADPAPAFRFVAFGDSGSGDQAQLDVAARIAASEPELGLHVGDIVYPGGDPADLDRKYFAVYAETIASAPFYIALGNKEVDFLDGGGGTLEAFHFPENGPVPERSYSFVHGNALFVALDTNAGLEASGISSSGSPTRSRHRAHRATGKCSRRGG